MKFSHPRGFTRPLSHSEYFEQPLELASGLANADVVLSGDGSRPLTSGGEVVIIRHPNALSPGTFGKLNGRLAKARSRSSLNSQRWHSPREEQRTIAAQARQNRVLSGMFAGTCYEAKVLAYYHLPVATSAPHPRRRKPKSSPPPPRPSTVPQPCTWTPSTSPGMLAFCADLRAKAAPFKARIMVRLKPRVISEVSTASAWGTSRL